MPDFDDISYKLEGGKRFNYRVGAYIHCANKILLHKPKNIPFWNLVGGRVKLGEDTQTALIRELEEELGYNFSNLKIRKFYENFFTWQGDDVSEMFVVYDLKIDKTHKLYKTQEFELDNTTFKWFDVNDVKNKEVYCKPVLIYDMAKEVNWTFEKAVNREEGEKYE